MIATTHLRVLLLSVLALVPSVLTAQQLPRAIFTDPPHDTLHPARMVVLHIPSGGVRINGVAYLAAGAGRHPTFVLLHGLPGNEKNLDVAQAVRRAGWNAITVNYRGSWGSPGSFRFAQTLEDAAATLAYLRDSATVRELGVDTARIVLAGHSMGGWATAITAANDRGLRGAILISAVNMIGLVKRQPGQSSDSVRATAIRFMRDNMESLAGVTPEEAVDELMANVDAFDWYRAVPGLARMPLLVLTADDNLAPGAVAFVDSIRAHGNRHVTLTHMATDHSWSDRRIALEANVIRWLQALGGRRAAGGGRRAAVTAPADR